MPEFSTEIDITIDDFLYECSNDEIKELIEALQEDGHIRKDSIIEEDGLNILDEEWLTVTNKLITLRLRLSPEEEQLIKEIVNRY